VIVRCKGKHSDVTRYNTNTTSYSVACERKIEITWLQKKGTSWYRRLDDVVSTFNVQKSLDSSRVFINVAIFVDPNKVAGPYLPYYKADIRYRLDNFIDNDNFSKIDVLFNFRNNLEPKKRLHEIAIVMENIVIPMFSNFSSASSVAAYFKSTEGSKASAWSPEGRKILDME
jgi:hypothetical protein